MIAAHLVDPMLLVGYHDTTSPCHGIYIRKCVKAEMQATVFKFTWCVRGALLGPTVYRIGPPKFLLFILEAGIAFRLLSQ